MASKPINSIDPGQIPTHGPAWTLYAYSAFAVLVIIGLIVGFLRAGAPF
jgi:hypothetical protein